MLLTIGDFNQYYDVIGEGIPLLCLHAFPLDSRMWHEQHCLGDVARLIIPDLRGVGRSSVTAGPYTMNLLASDMLALLDHLEIDRAVVMGVSMGVYVAFAMYVMAPDRFRGFIIADSRPEADTPEAAQRRQKTVDGLLTQGTAILIDRVNDLFAETTRRERPELVAEIQQQVAGQNARGLAEQTLGMALRPDRTSLLPRIQAPTLTLCGEEDTVSPCEVVKTMTASIPGARFHSIANAGHLSPLEHPAAFNTLVGEFVGSL